MKQYFSDLWNGNKSLLHTFLIWNVIGWGFMNYLSRYLTRQYMTVDNVGSISWLLFVLGFSYFFFSSKCLGSCGAKFNKTAAGIGKIWYPLIIGYISINAFAYISYFFALLFI